MAEVITCIAFSPSGMTVAVCDLSKRTVVFDTTNYETLSSYIAPEPCTAIAFCGERMLCVCTMRGHVCLLDVQARDALCPIMLEIACLLTLRLPRVRKIARSKGSMA